MEFKFYRNIISRINNQPEGKIVFYRSISIILLMALTAYMVYFAPEGIDKLFCAILLVIFWYSKSNYFWFAFFLIISAYPGGLFTQSSGLYVRRLPIYSPIAKMSFSVMDLFLIVAFFKALTRGNKIKIIDIFKIKKIVIIIPFIVITSFFFGMTLKMFLNQTVRGLFFYTLFFSFPALISNKKEVFKFMYMYIPFAFIEFLSQIYTLKTGSEFANLFDPGSISTIMDPFSGGIRSIPIGYITMRLSYIFAFILLEHKDNILPKSYLMLVILACLTSVIISATRSSIVMFSFIFIFYYFFIARRKPGVLMQTFIIGVIFVMVLDATNIFDLNSLVGSSYTRFVGAVSIEEGSIKPEDTFDNRVSNRLPILLDAIKKSPLIGYGFSDAYFDVYDGHLGGVIVGLLQVGFIGYSLYVMFIVNIFRKCFKYIKKFRDDNSFKNIVKVFTVAFFGYSIVNLTVDPVFVLNTSTLPQDIFILLVLACFFINLGINEHITKKLEKKYALAS